jgi:hypothetical protein
MIRQSGETSAGEKLEASTSNSFSAERTFEYADAEEPGLLRLE